MAKGWGPTITRIKHGVTIVAQWVSVVTHVSYMYFSFMNNILHPLISGDLNKQVSNFIFNSTQCIWISNSRHEINRFTKIVTQNQFGIKLKTIAFVNGIH
jgi:hypothetical protein